MRIRSTRPEFYRSERVARVSWDARYVLKALESYVDDNGVGKHDLELIVGDLFMRDLVREPSRTLARVSETISELSEAGLVWLYEADGTDLLYIAFWEEIQRIDKPQPGRFRRPDGTLHYKESSIRDSLATPREDSRALAPVTGEQGNRGTGEQTLSSADADASAPTAPTRATIDADFDAWYAEYPRKEARGQAVKAYRAARKKADAETLLNAIRRHAPVMLAGESRFIPLPATWLNGERWLDQPVDDQPVTASSGGYFAPFTPGPPPREIEDDPRAVHEWLEGKRAEHLARTSR